MTLSLVAVFIPVMFMGGIIGRLLHEFAVTISAAILVSGFVSLTLTPMLASRYLKHDAPGEAQPAVLAVRAGLRQGLLAGYRASLTWSLAHRPLGAAGVLRHRGGQRLAVPGDSQGLPAQRRFRPDHRLHRRGAGRLLRQHGAAPAAVAAIAANNPNIETFMSVVGSGGSRITPNTGIMLFKLKPARGGEPAHPDAGRADPGTAAQAVLRARHQGVPAEPAAHPPGRPDLLRRQYQYTLQDTDLDELYKWTDTLLTRMRKLPGFVDVNSNLNNKSPVMALDVDRDKLAALGLASARWRTPCKAPSAPARSPPSTGPPTSTR
jgi:HAE1 family hydrophobic/amphiphilic exporter-1